MLSGMDSCDDAIVNSNESKYICETLLEKWRGDQRTANVFAVGLAVLLYYPFSEKLKRWPSTF